MSGVNMLVNCGGDGFGSAALRPAYTRWILLSFSSLS